MQTPKNFFVHEKVFTFLLILFALLGLNVILMHYKEQMNDTKNAILQNAHIHILGLINIKSWNDFYDGVYVKKRTDVNNSFSADAMACDENQTLIRINHAWMLRQLSERNRCRHYRFKISSLHPKNPLNQADNFEARALRYLEQNREAKHYYQFDEENKQLYYLVPLKTEAKCLRCHANEKTGDIRGGITIVHDTAFLYDERNSLLKYSAIVGAVFFGMILFILMIYRLLLRHNRELILLNETLEEKVNERTMKLDEQNIYLQAVLDSSPDIIIITDGEHLLSANGTFFNFFHYKTLDAFRAEHDCICDFFEKVDEIEYLHDKQIDGVLWPYYLLEHPEIKHKVQMTVDYKTMFFSINARALEGSTNKVLVELSDITEIESQKKSFEKLAITDKLTGIINRFQFDVLFAHNLNNAKRYHEPLSLIMFDIDFFKKINDFYGHDIGDTTLQHVAQTILQRLRSADIFARWGGEEFMILLPKTSLDDAMELAEDLRRAVEEEVFDSVGHITISFGVALMEPEDEGCDLLKRADKALYTAKHNGRNRVEYCP